MGWKYDRTITGGVGDPAQSTESIYTGQRGTLGLQSYIGTKGRGSVTTLERRALLGDRQSQEECTRLGIVLHCPLCGGKADKVVYDAAGMFVCKKCKIYKPFTLVIDGARKALTVWNTRTAPPIGRCASCACWDENT